MKMVDFTKTIILGQILSISICSLILSPSVEAQDREYLKKGVVKLSIRRSEDLVETGAGVIVGTADNYVFILTALHVVVGDEIEEPENIKIVVQFHEHQRKPIIAKLYPRFDEDLDLAIIYVKMKNPTTVKFWTDLRLANLNKVKEVDEILALGHPAANPWQISTGNITRLETNEIQYSGDAVYPGNSGGALLNKNGDLIGIVTRRATETGFAVRMDVARDKLNEWQIPLQLEPVKGSKIWWFVGGGAVIVAGGTLAIVSGRGVGGEADNFPNPPGRPSN